MQLALFLVHAAETNDPEWGAYLDEAQELGQLPPVVWGEEELQELQGTQVAETVMQYRCAHHTDDKQIANTVFEAGTGPSMSYCANRGDASGVRSLGAQEHAQLSGHNRACIVRCASGLLQLDRLFSNPRVAISVHIGGDAGSVAVSFAQYCLRCVRV